MKGLIHLYTGNGKGKTTAALGLALRFAGHGKRVIIVQFCKGRETGELNSLALIPEVTVLRNSRDFGFWKTMSETDRAACADENNSNLLKAAEAAYSGNCDLLVLDELSSAYENCALDRDLIKELIIKKPPLLELVLTGRNPADFMLQAADYISEIKCLRHPYENGVAAREGAEF